jgi:hypothetical protein
MLVTLGLLCAGFVAAGRAVRVCRALAGTTFVSDTELARNSPTAGLIYLCICVSGATACIAAVFG